MPTSHRRRVSRPPQTCGRGAGRGGRRTGRARRRTSKGGVTRSEQEAIAVVLVVHLAGVGRKRSTLMDYESHLRVHLAPFFGAKPLHRIEASDIEAFIAAKRRDGRAPK